MTALVGDDGRGLSLRDLLLELRADLRAIDTKLEMKADRERVHDLSNEIQGLRLEAASRAHLIGEFAETKRKVGVLERRYWVSVGFLAAAELVFALYLKFIS